MHASSNPVVTIIGAGPAGLATAACLEARGIAYRLLEGEPAVGSSWRRHYQRLHLHTVKEYSALPGLPFPAQVERYPARELVVAYLEAYVRHHGLKVEHGVSLIRAAQVDGGWNLTTSAGELRSRALVLATGYNRVPHQPSWPGQDEFGKTVIHSRAYFNGEPFKNQRVLVVGLGNTGGELALDLLEHGAQVALSVRGPVHVVPRDFLGQPVQVTSIRTSFLPRSVRDVLGGMVSKLAFGNLEHLGIKRPEHGPATDIDVRGRIPLIDIGTIDAIRKGRILVYSNVESFFPGGVRFSDGRAAEFDAVVLATGYRPALMELLGPHPVFTPEGRPRGIDGGDGLYFVGFRNVATGLLRQAGIDAQSVAEIIARLPDVLAPPKLDEARQIAGA